MPEAVASAARPAVSIIIPHLNQYQALALCLQSIAEQDYPREQLEVLVVDNGSKEPCDAVVGRFPFARLLKEAVPGPGPARNKGVSAASHDLLAFIDADCRAEKGWVSAAVGALLRPDSHGVVGGDVQIGVANPPRLTALEAFESVFAFRQEMYIRQQGFSGTGNLAMRADIYHQVGPFGGIDVAEDRDWGQRALAQGLRTSYVPSMIVYHPARDTFDELKDKWRRHIGHDLFIFRESRKPALAWMARGLAILFSAIPHSITVMCSDRLSGFGNRLRGIGVLFRIRAFRCVEMIRQFNYKDRNAASGWNR